MSELPEGWGCCKVQDLFKSFSGGTPSRENAEYWNGNIPWLSSGDIKSDRIDTSSELITESGLNNSSAKLCRPGSVVVVVRSGILKHTLPVAILEKEAAINQDIKCFDSGDDSLNQWLAFSLKALSKKILSLNREGTTVQSVEYDTLKEFELRVPPLSEQRRIVAKLKPLLGSIETYRQRLAKLPVVLKRFRQAVLAAACSGKLTADWRGQHLTTADSEKILISIRESRLIKAKSETERARIKAVYEYLEEKDSGTLPERWQFVTLSKLCESFDYGTSAKSQPIGDVPVLRMGNIQNGEIDWSDLVYSSDPEEIRKYSLNSMTVLFNRTNSPELVGKTAIYRGERQAIFAGYLIRANHCDVLDPEYLNYCLNTSDAKEFCQRIKSDGVSQSNINAQKLGTFEVPFCSIEEQKEIVRRVNVIFKLVGQIEARYQRAKPMVDKLPQSILAKAFRGELVPTEAELARREGRDYEPASVLLERIKSERAEQANGRKEKARSQLKPTKGKVSGVAISKS